jgi:hypothetical protein
MNFLFNVALFWDVRKILVALCVHFFGTVAFLLGGIVLALIQIF